MKKSHILKMLVTTTIFIALLVSCSGPSTPETATTYTIIDRSGKLINNLLQQRNETAFEAYYYAKKEAQIWNNASTLYQIPSTVIISENIGLPAPGVYWFFMFSTDDNLREYYIAVSDGEIAGTFEAEPLLFEELPYEFQSLDTSLLIDSDVALRLCVENNLLDPQEVINHNQIIDYRLLDLGSNPVWSLYLTGSEPFLPFCNVDAVTGDFTNDPFIKFINFE